jgi:hypothetical protein
MGRKIALAVGLLFALVLVVLYALGSGVRGRHEAPGQISETRRPDAVVAGTGAAVAAAADAIGGRAPAGRRLRLRALLFGPRLLVDQRSRGADHPAPLARDHRHHPPVQ